MSNLHENWVVDPRDTVIMIPVGAASPELMKYVYQRFPEENVVPVKSSKGLIEMRNSAMYDVVLGAMRHKNHFVWFDDDLFPDYRTDAMFQVQADIVGCRFEARNEGAWQMPDDVHNSAIRFHRRVAEAMADKPPFYKYEYNMTYTECVKCECRWFRDRARELGFTIARAGYSKHGNQGKWHA